MKAIQQSFESKAQGMIRMLRDNGNIHDCMQVKITRFAWECYHEGQEDYCYCLINEGFNHHYIAGYKYLEWMTLLNRKGEFSHLAEKDPLMNL